MRHRRFRLLGVTLKTETNKIVEAQTIFLEHISCAKL
jgi:hypothetical protein